MNALLGVQKMVGIRLTTGDLTKTWLRTSISVAGLLILGTGVFWYLGENSRYAAAKNRLVETQGTITSVTNSLRYDYEVDGQALSGSRACLIPRNKARGVPSSESATMALDWAKSAGITVGDQVRVYYLPSDPNLACLDSNHPAVGIWLIWFSPWLVLVVTAFLSAYLLIIRFLMARQTGENQ